MHLKLLIVLSALLLLLGASVAVGQEGTFDTGTSGYAGINSQLTRANDPHSRYRYFGPSYQSTFGGYGSKAANPTDYGSKGATSVKQNLDTNSYSAQGRNVNRISNVDPNFRGYSRIDVSVDLQPMDLLLIESKQKTARATARITSKGDQYGAGTNEPNPTTDVRIQTQNLPPVGENRIYEAWLVDEDTEYALSIGFLRSGLDLASSLTFSFSRSAAPFDAVMITSEPFPDKNPQPGDAVLYGTIRPSRIVLRTPATYAPETVR